ncbi:MAG: polyprenyl synthetase family protein [Paramuribaculum sp.]|nr:polyprenyl synthetase family protein [Paramuribaculum sp.]
MTSIDDIKNSLKPELQLLGERLEQSLTSSNQLMNRVVEEYLRSKGKMIRPILVILTAKLFADVNENVIASAAAVELLHNASLIHDDVVDNSSMRRGLPTVNSVWDNHIAVLVGDFFVSTALQQALSTNDIRIVGSLAMLGKLLSLGEIDQIYNARYHKLSEEAYFEVISRKTASLFVSCVEIGGYAVGANSNELEAIREYARLLGLCFQIKDDIFDYYHDESVVGKPTGNDLREGKITLPLLYALEHCSGAESENMRELTHKECLDEHEINALLEFAKNNGGIEYSYKVMDDLRGRAFDQLDKLPQTEATDAFRAIFSYVISRNK